MYQQIISTEKTLGKDEFNSFLESDEEIDYFYSKGHILGKLNRLQKSVLMTKNNDYINEMILDFIKESPEHINEKNNMGLTALNLACGCITFASNLKTIKILLENGADSNIPDNYGYTPLISAVIFGTDDKIYETVLLLMKHGANPNLKDNNGMTALMHSTLLTLSETNLEIVKLLLENKSNPNIQDKNGLNALTMLLKNCYKYSTLDTMVLLLDYKTIINIDDIYSQVDDNPNEKISKAILDLIL